MHLTLLRHGDALPPEPATGDRGRPLSARGRADAHATGVALAARAAPTHAWSSPLLRARQTADLVLAALPTPPPLQITPDLAPEADPTRLLAALSALPPAADLLLVTHEPLVSALAGDLLRLRVTGFPTAAAYRLYLDPAGPPGPLAPPARLLWRWLGRFID